MIWTRSIDLYYDVDARGPNALLKIDGSSVSAGSTLALVLADVVPLRVFLRRINSDGSMTAIQLAANHRLVFGGKSNPGDSESDLLFSCADLAETGSGDDLHYAGLLNLNTEELIDAMENNPSLPCICDLEAQNADNTQRLTLQCSAVVRAQVYAGEGEPAPAAPAYPAPGSLVVKNCGTVAIPDGADQVVVSGLALGVAPAQVLLTVRKPTAGANLFASLVDGSESATGFTVSLSAAAPAAGYKLDYLLVMP